MAVTPFLAAQELAKLNVRKWLDIQPANNTGMPIIPQLMGNEPRQMTDTLKALSTLGYQQVNWNIGCPSAQVVRKQRGCGLMPSFIDDVSVSSGQGSFKVDEADFRKLYEFVQRLLERLEKDAHLVIFSFSSRFGSRIEPEIVNDFTTVVQRCLRKGDISCKSGHSLYVILLGADKNGSEVVAKRLIETFWSVCDDDAYDIDYEIKPINS